MSKVTRTVLFFELADKTAVVRAYHGTQVVSQSESVSDCSQIDAAIQSIELTREERCALHWATEGWTADFRVCTAVWLEEGQMRACSFRLMPGIGGHCGRLELDGEVMGRGKRPILTKNDVFFDLVELASRTEAHRLIVEHAGEALDNVNRFPVSA
ncbi:hypothetical protein C0581_00095 [Candidatus Parcubacteria bacterium]|nr:MAG: hypothetical protein C0581_00095 [Candidatus Parcubacteria bacterium]